MTSTLRISRQQLAAFLKNDHDAIRQFETLFNTVANPDTTAAATEPEIQVETAAHEALARIERLERAFQMMELEPRSPTSSAAGSGKLLQDIVQMGSTGTTTTTVTSDAPTITQGMQIASISITPTAIGSKLIVRAKVRGKLSAGYHSQHVAIFKDGASANVTYSAVAMLTSGWPVENNVLYVMTTTSLTAITFALRAGSATAGTFTAYADSWLEVQEVAA